MELTKNYDGKRWKLVYGDYCGMEAHAVDLVQAAIKRFVPYILPVYRYDNVPDDGRNTVYVGTKDSNPFVGEKLADVSPADDGICVRVTDDGREASEMFHSEATAFFDAFATV